MADAKQEKVSALFEFLQALVEVVKAGDSLGVPAGHMYAMLMSKMSLDQFNILMSSLVRSGKIKLSNHCYYYVEK